MPDDRRIIEEFIPIKDIGINAAGETKNLPQILRWRARRPLAACRAIVYSTLMPAANRDDGFLTSLSRFPGDSEAIGTARENIAHLHNGAAGKTSGEGGTPPRVLDMFGGRGSIPLECLRLGCDAYSVELNPVAYLLQLCTIYYPQKFFRPDSSVAGSGKDHEWTGLVKEVRTWSAWIQDTVSLKLRPFYLPILPRRNSEARLTDQEESDNLVPLAYLWTRTVRCKKPSCGAVVPLVRQTWLARLEKRYIALKASIDEAKRTVKYKVVESPDPSKLGFDPSKGSVAGNVECPFCHTVEDIRYVKAQGKAGLIGNQLLAVCYFDSATKRKFYLTEGELNLDQDEMNQRIATELHSIQQEFGLSPPDEPLPPAGTLGFRVQPYGFKSWGDLFTSRQNLALLSFSIALVAAQREMLEKRNYDEEHALAIITVLALSLSRLAEWNSGFCTWFPGPKIGTKSHGGENTLGTFSRQAIPMVWDFAEINPLSGTFGGWISTVSKACDWIDYCVYGIKGKTEPATVIRGTATQLPFEDSYFDAIITDPPYYDNVPYAALSDFFYVWLKRSIGKSYPEHFASEVAPRRNEIVADPSLHHGSKEEATTFYENSMFEAFKEANRVLKPGRPFVCVYAHKTTAGWTTLVDALRRAGFTVTEAWPIEMEMGARMRALGSAALASSIVLTARSRIGQQTASYEKMVLPELRAIVKNQVAALWDTGITGADLVIAAVGAGLRAYTRFSRVEFENGDQMLPDRFLLEVEGLVLNEILERLGLPRVGVEAVDPSTRFYVLWRYTYGQAIIVSGEAIVFAYPQGVELDGIRGLSSGPRALLEKKSGKYRLLSYLERGDEEKLGLSSDSGEAPLIDKLHRILWLMENQPGKLGEYVKKARPNLDQLKLVAQALAGPLLKGHGKELSHGPPHEGTALEKLLAHWEPLVESYALSKEEQLSISDFSGGA